jgi:hypothetical protein
MLDRRRYRTRMTLSLPQVLVNELFGHPGRRDSSRLVLSAPARWGDTRETPEFSMQAMNGVSSEQKIRRINSLFRWMAKARKI